MFFHIVTQLFAPFTESNVMLTFSLLENDYLCTLIKHHFMERKASYIVTVIRKFAEHYSISIKEAYRYLKQYQGIAFLDDCYEAEHTLSFDDAVEDSSRVCQIHGGGLRYA